MNRSV
jgi:hypothetical protein